MHDQDSLRAGSTDATPGGQWMTVAELAALRGISKGSVTRLVQRQRWRQQPDHQGRVRVWVPQGATEPGDGRLANQLSDTPDDRQAAASGALRKRAERAEARARKAEQAQAATEVAAGKERNRAAALIAQAKAALAAERKARVAAEAAIQQVAEVDRAVQIAMQAEAA